MSLETQTRTNEEKITVQLRGGIYDERRRRELISPGINNGLLVTSFNCERYEPGNSVIYPKSIAKRMLAVFTAFD